MITASSDKTKEYKARMAARVKAYRDKLRKDSPVTLRNMYARSRKKTAEREINDPVYRAKCAEYHREWAKKNGHMGLNPDKYRKRKREYNKLRRQSDPSVWLADALRSRTRNALVNQSYKKPRHNSVTYNLGCTYVELRAYIENKFLPGMSWANKNEWHIDHVQPLAGFDLSDPKQFAVAAHHTNLRPLWKTDNILKSDLLPSGKRARDIVLKRIIKKK